MDFDEYSDDYGKHVSKAVSGFGRDQEFYLVEKAKVLCQMLESRMGPLENLDVLDFGCGNGEFARFLTGQFRNLHGIDVSAASIETARKMVPDLKASSYDPDGHSIPFPDESFDVVFACCVFHHIPKGERGWVSSEIRRVLKPGGRAVILEHNPFNPATRIVVARCPFDADAELLSARSARKQLEGAGLKPDGLQYVFVTPFDDRLPWILKLGNRLHLGAQYLSVSAKEN